MALILKKLIRGYFWIYEETRDTRTDHFYFTDTVFHPFLIGGTYLLLIHKILPEFMKNRRPFKFDNILIAFNLTQMLVNGYICYYAFKELIPIDWSCAPIDYSDTPHNRFVLRLIYIYFLTKVADLMDTVFFILRGKTNQVSFLHVYHHFGMILLSWSGVRFFGGGHSLFLGFVNTFVHTVMYFYYLMTIWKPEYKKNIWWKKYITQIQLAQFIFFLIIYGQLLFKPDCPFPKVASYFIVPQNLFMIALFGDFYWKTYIKPQKAKKE